MSLKRILDDKIEEIFLVFTLVVMVVLIFMQVIGRYVFESSLTWSEETARYVHIWQVWIGASYAIRQGAHIKVEAFKNIFNKKSQIIIDLLAVLLWSIITLFLAIYGTNLVMTMFARGQLSPAMRIPMWIPYTAIPVGGTLMSIRLVQQIYLLIKSFRQAER